jgi:hypothetical protein
MIGFSAYTLALDLCMWRFSSTDHGCVVHCSLEALSELMTPDVKLLVVNFPHNPSGWMPSQQQWQQIVGMARQVSGREGGRETMSDEPRHPVLTLTLGVMEHLIVPHWKCPEGGLPWGARQSRTCCWLRF